MSFQIDEVVGYNLKEIRLNKNMTQQFLANLTNVSKQTISNIEKGQGANSKTLERIAQYLDVSPLDFYKEVSEVDIGNVEFKRASTKGIDKCSSINYDYVKEITLLITSIVNDTKENIYYQKVLPVVKDIFKNNRDILLDKLDAVKSHSNYIVLYDLEEIIISGIKQVIYDEQEEAEDKADDIVMDDGDKLVTKKPVDTLKAQLICKTNDSIKIL